MINAKQKGVLLGMVTGFGVSLLAGFVPLILPPLTLTKTTTQYLIQLWMLVSLVLGFWLLLSIVAMAIHRFFHAADIDAATSDVISRKARILQSIIQNTLEQVVLAIIVYGAWIFLAPQNWKLLPVIYVILFSCGRLLFVTRYNAGAAARSFGFAITFYPTIILICALVFMQV